MEAIVKDLEKLSERSEKLGKTGSDLVQGIIDRLEIAYEAIQRDPSSVAIQLAPIIAQIKAASTKLTDGQKECYASLQKFGKDVDKKFSTSLDAIHPSLASFPTPTTSIPSLLSLSHDPFHDLPCFSKEAQERLDHVIGMHFVRSGRGSVAEKYFQESNVALPQDVLDRFGQMHSIVEAVQNGDLGPATSWAESHADFIEVRKSPLLFHLHRSQFVRLLLASPVVASASSFSAPVSTHLQGANAAIAYARDHFPPFFTKYGSEISRLMTATLYLPIDRLLASPYSDVISPSPSRIATTSSTITPDEFSALQAAYFVPLFCSEFCASLGMSKDLPLTVATDIGGSGALSRIIKVNQLMKEKRNEWTTQGEIPVEIPLPPAYRYHSIFTCPVSKEQATETNWPMMLPCGHVIAKESLNKLAKGSRNVKCPYCPHTGQQSQALRIYF